MWCHVVIIFKRENDNIVWKHELYMDGITARRVSLIVFDELIKDRKDKFTGVYVSTQYKTQPTISTLIGYIVIFVIVVCKVT